MLASGDVRGAAEAFIAIGERYPGESIAADATFSGAMLLEERLGDPERAVSLYRSITRHYPDSRVALAASRRLESLEGLLVGDRGGEAVAAWKAILAGAPSPGASPGELEARARALLREHPGWSGAARVHIWLAERARARGALERAREDLMAARELARTPADRYEAGRLHAAVLAADGEFEEADRVLASLDAGDDPVQRQLILGQRVRLSRQHLRHQLRSACLAGMALALMILVASLWRAAGSRAKALRALARPPVELWFLLPVLVLLTGMALTSHRDMGPAVAIISAAGITFTWISGAGLRLSRSRRRLALHLVAVLLGVGCAIYVAVHHGQLIDELIDTVRLGPEA